jgi:hypothetical protein
MTTNFEKLSGAKAFSPVYREVDMGGFADELAGTVLQVRVNPPAIADSFINIDRDNVSFEQVRRAVMVYYDLSAEAVNMMDDSMVSWMATEATTLYTAYHEGLKEKGFLAPLSSNGSSPIITK